MIKYRISIFRWLNLFSDAGTVFCAFVLSFQMHKYIESGLFESRLHQGAYLSFAVTMVILWPLLLFCNGLYPTDRLRTWKRAALIIFKSSAQGFISILAVCFVFKLQQISRMFIFQLSTLITLLLILKESLIIYYLHLARKKGGGVRNVLVVGTLASAKAIALKIEENSYLGLRVVGLLLPHAEMSHEEAKRLRVLGSLSDIERVIHDFPVDHVIITVDRHDYREVDSIILHCEEEGIEIWISANLFNIKIARLDSDELFGIPIFVFRSGPTFSWALVAKIFIEWVTAFILGIVALPIMLIAAVLIKLTSPGKVFFTQERCGHNGRRFTLYKLRTMYNDAEARRQELEAHNILKGPVFKLEHDPRITPVGRILRKCSIDEIPQFWNVVKGEMALIGPRPPLPSEVQLYKGWQRRRLRMRPGITGLWQVSGRNQVLDFDKLAQLDLKYIDNWSLWLDIKIFFKTIIVVLSTKGAK